MSPLPGENNPEVENRRAFWLEQMTGTPAPAWQMVEVDWSGSYYRGGTALGDVSAYSWPWGY